MGSPKKCDQNVTAKSESPVDSAKDKRDARTVLLIILVAASGPLARKYYMFTVDYATLTVTAACTLFYIYDTRQFNLMDNNTNGGLVGSPAGRTFLGSLRA